MTPASHIGRWQQPASTQQIHYQMWCPPSAKVLLVIVHGFGEYGGRYSSVAEELAGQGFCVAIPDLPGHGRSSGARGDIADLPACAQTLARLAEEVFLPASGQNRYVLYGHSFGGLLAIWWAMHFPEHIYRLTVQSPLLEVAFRIPLLTRLLSRLVRMCCPGMLFSLNLDASALSHDPTVVSAYRNDPLVHNKMSARCYGSVLATRNAITAHPEGLTKPTLLLYGTADRIVDVEVVKKWFERLTCKKQSRAFADAYHELHHEPVRQQLLKELAAWATA